MMYMSLFFRHTKVGEKERDSATLFAIMRKASFFAEEQGWENNPVLTFLPCDPWQEPPTYTEMCRLVSTIDGMVKDCFGLDY